MALPAGRAPAAASVVRLQPTPYSAIQTGNAGANQALSTTETDLLGCSVSFSVATLATCVVVATAHFLTVATGAAAMEARLSVDGVIQAGVVRMTGTSAGLEATCSQVWRFAFSATGSHTLKLRGAKSAAVGDLRTGDNNTGFVVAVYEVV